MDQIRFVNFFQRRTIFIKSGGKCLNANRPAVILMIHRFQDQAINPVQSQAIHALTLECLGSQFTIHHTIAVHFRKVPDSPQQAVCQARCPARSARDFLRANLVDLDAKD